jgi:isopentenyl-diphosphate Delta-isomerase
MAGATVRSFDDTAVSAYRSEQRPPVTLPDGGTEDIWKAHSPPGTLHVAVSVQLVTPDGRWLLQRRSQAKPLFAGKWANSCCTHPMPEEEAQAAASRRVTEELGIDAVALVPAGAFIYEAADPASGMVEHEHDHVFVGVTDVVPAADPSEIDELWYGTFEDALAKVRGEDGAPWAGTVLELCGARARTLTHGAGPPPEPGAPAGARAANEQPWI